jgi:hypothetical protein
MRIYILAGERMKELANILQELAEKGWVHLDEGESEISIWFKPMGFVKVTDTLRKLMENARISLMNTEDNLVLIIEIPISKKEKKIEDREMEF